MSTVINATEDVMKKSVASDHVQFLPCSIDFTGTTQIQERFNKFTDKAEDGTLTNSIRGFPLDGKVVSLPSDYKGKSAIF